MATRIYLPNTGAAVINPTFGTWTETTGADRIQAVTTRISSAMTNKVQAHAATAANSTFLSRQYVIGPLAGQTYAASTIKGTIRVLESAVNDNLDAMRLLVRVVAPDANTFRGTIYGPTNGTVLEFNTSLRAKRLATGGATTQVVVTEGDYLVIDIGTTSTVGGTSLSDTISYGDDSATDLGDNETDTTALNPFVELAGNIKFLQRGYGQANAKIKATVSAPAQAQAYILFFGGSSGAQARINSDLLIYGEDRFGRADDLTGLGLADKGGYWFPEVDTGADITPAESGHYRIASNRGQYVDFSVDAYIDPYVDFIHQRTRTQNSDAAITFNIVAYTANTSHVFGLTSRFNSAAFKWYHANVLLQTSTNTYFLEIFKSSTGQLTSVAIAQPTAGVDYRIRFQTLTVGGDVLLRAKVWQLSTGEPTAWMVSVTDTAPNATYLNGSNGLISGIQQPGAYTVNFDNYIATEPAYYGYGQAQALISGKNAFGQAQADIKATSRGFGQALALIPNWFSAQSHALVNGTFTSVVDTFTRSVTNGLGSADTGGTYTIVSGSAADYDVTGTEFTITAQDSVNYIFQLPSTLIPKNHEALITYKISSLPPSATTHSFSIFTLLGSTKIPGDSTGIYGQLNLLSNGSLNVRVDIEGTGTQGNVGAVLTVGDYWYMKLRVLSTNSDVIAFAKSWKVGASEPAWHTSQRVTTPLLPPGHSGIFVRANGTPIITFDDFNIYQAFPVGHGQANAYIKAIGITRFGQAQADIKATGRGFGQAQADIKATNNSFGQAQADIKAVGLGFGQALSDIKATSNSFGQANADINAVSSRFGQAQAQINPSDAYGALTYSDAPIAWWRVDESSGSVAKDVFGTPGTYTSSPTLGATTLVAGGTSAVTFNGTTQSMSGRVLSLGNGPWSYKIWIKRASAGTPATALPLMGAGANSGGMSITDGGRNTAGTINVYKSGVNYAVHSNVTILDTNIHEVIVTKNVANVWKIYVDGIDVSDYTGDAVGLTTVTTAVAFGVGIDPNTGLLFAGTIDEPAVYNYELTAAQVAADYAAGTATGAPTRFAQAQADIKQTYVQFGQAQADIKQIYFGLGQAQADIKQTYQGYAQAQANVKATSNGFGQANADILAKSNVFAQAQADIKQTYTQFAQSQAGIKQTYQVYAQAQADIKATTPQFAQAQADIKAVSNGYGQAQSDIKQTYVQFAQAQADIKQIYQGYGQAQADIKAVSNGFGQAQSDIKATSNGYGQANSDIKATSNSYAQAQADILTTNTRYAQANAWIKTTANACGQAQGHIRRTESAFGQAQGLIDSTRQYGQAQASILPPNFFTYGQANALIGVSVDLYRFIDEFTPDDTDLITTSSNDVTDISYAVGLSDLEIPEFAQDYIIRIRAYKTESKTSTLTVELADDVSVVASRLITLTQVATTYEYRLTALEIAAIVNYDALKLRVTSDTSGVGQPTRAVVTWVQVQMPAGTIKKLKGYAQAQAFIAQSAANQYGQAQGQIKAFGVNGYGQAQADIKVTSNSFGQAQANIKQIYQQFAQAQSDIKAISSSFAQAQADIKATSNGFGQSQADIKQIYNQFGQSQADIKQTYQSYGQSQADIKAIGYGFGQSQADIKATLKVFAQAQADILATANGFGQSQADIKATAYQNAQAQAKINAFKVNGFGQAQADIKATSQSYGQSQALISRLTSGAGQAQADIKATSQTYGQAQSDIKVVSYVSGQAQGYLKRTETGSANAQGLIKTVVNKYGQAQGSVKQTYQNFAQAQASIRTNVTQFAQAQGTIRATNSATAQAEAFISKSAGYAQAEGFIRQEHQLKNVTISDRHSILVSISNRHTIITTNSDTKTMTLTLSDRSINLTLSDRARITLTLNDRNY